MARTATKFDDHKDFGPFPLTPAVAADPANGVEAQEAQLNVVTGTGITHEMESVVASDAETKRSGEVQVPIYKAEGLDAVLQLFGGSEAELTAAAVGFLNGRTRLAAKNHVVNSIIGPEKAMAKTVKRVAKALGIDEDILKAKFADNPAYRDMILELAK